MPEEDVISLVVEGDCSSTGELWIVGEETCKHPRNRVSEARLKTIRFRKFCEKISKAFVL